MGLDAVEIVMEVERAFDITLEDAEVEKISTPRELIEVVLGKVAQADAAGCLTHQIVARVPPPPRFIPFLALRPGVSNLGFTPRPLAQGGRVPS